MPRGFEIDWVIIRVNSLRRATALGLTALLAALLLAFAYLRLNLPPPARARQAIERAEASRNRVLESSVVEAWRSEIRQASSQLSAARSAYVDEHWSLAIDQAEEARRRFNALLGVGDRGVVGVGQVFSLDGRVTVQRAGKPDWDPAAEGMPVFNGDFVRTGKDGSAEILFADGSLYRIAPNSLLEIHQNRRATSDAGGNVKMRVGRINVYTSSSPSTVTTESAETRVEGASRVAVDVAETNRETVVEAYSGGARVRNPGGGEVVLGSRERVSARPDGSFSEKARLPEPPRMLSPENNAGFDVEARSIVELRWRLAAPGLLTHLQVSRSKHFLSDRIDLDANKLGKDFARLKAVSPGTYYWRVAAVDHRALQSEWSVPRHFQVFSPDRRLLLEDTAPPKLTVEPARQLGTMFIVEGHTEAGASVSVNGEPAELDASGHFRKMVDVGRAGWNELAVVAVDPSGNRTELRQRVFVEVY